MKHIHRNARYMLSILLCLALVLSLGTMGAFADTLICTTPEHYHTDDCYAQCDIPTLVEHVHDEECEEGCTITWDIAHEHDEDCRPCICGLEHHLHDSSCYAKDEITEPQELIYEIDGETCSYELVSIGETRVIAPDAEKEGYTFSGWSIPDDELLDIVDGQFKMPAHKVIFSGSFAKNIEVSAEYYVQAIGGGYELYKTVSLSEAPGKVINADQIEIEGFTFDADNAENVLSATEDGAVMKLFYDRNSYTVTYTYGTNTVTEDHLFDETFDLLQPAKPGCTFTGWDGVDGTSFTMPAGDVSFNGFLSRDYVVEHYTQKLDGSYELRSSDAGSAIVGDTVHASLLSLDGFTVAPGNVTLPIKEDGSAVLKIYYTRNQHTVTFIVDGKVSSTETHLYGDAVTVSQPTKKGYVFSGWTADVAVDTKSFNMPDANVTFTGNFDPADGVMYKVITFRQNEKGEYEEVETVIRRGVTGTLTEITAPELEGYALQPIQQKTIRADGYTVINVYYNVTGAKYTVITYREVSAGVFDEGTEEIFFGEPGAYTSVVAPVLDDYMLASGIMQQQIKADGSTVVELYYVRTITDVALPATLGADVMSITGPAAPAAEGAAAVEQAVVVDSFTIDDDATPLAGGDTIQNGISSWIFVLGAAVVLGGLFILFMKRRNNEEET